MVEKTITPFEDLEFGPLGEVNAGEGEMVALAYFEGPVDFTLAE